MESLPTMSPSLCDTEAHAQPLYSFAENFIGGHWREGQGPTATDVVDPYSMVRLAEIPNATPGDVHAAFCAAQIAQRLWGQLLPPERSVILYRAAKLMEARKEEIVSWIIRESGSTRIKASLEWDTVHSSCLESAGLASRATGRIIDGNVLFKENRVYRKPVGVVAVISPWNWPLHLTSRSVLPALALGNSVVLKPATETPISGGLILGKLLEEAGLPPGVLNVVVGPSSLIGDAFLSDPVSRVISFTGSTSVGRHVGELASTGQTLKKAMLELGGNNPLVVLSDADLEQAVEGAIVSKFLHQGQMCICVNRIIVDKEIYPAFVDKFIARTKSLKIGDPNEPDTVIGPVVKQGHLEKLLHIISTAREQGATQAVGGEVHRLLLPPHVFVDLTEDMAIGRGEIFGPIAAIYSARGDEDALRMANNTEYGLSSSIYTQDAERGLRFARGVEAGMTHINDVTANDMPTLPFGGEKNSGLGRFGTEGVINQFTTEHWISVQHRPRVFPF